MYTMTQDSGIVLGTSHLWTENIHGRDEKSNPNIDCHWIFHDEVDSNEIGLMPGPPTLRYEVCIPTLLNTGECSAIFKTMWLKIVQRRWKEIYRLRMQVMNERGSVNSLKYRQRHGKWPVHLNNLPSISGMLNHLR